MMHSRVSALVLFFVQMAMAEVWVPHRILHMSPSESVHAETTPVFKTWSSTDFMNPMPTPIQVTAKPVTENEGEWLAMEVEWFTSDPKFPQLDFAEYQVWRAQDKGSFSFRGFVSFGSRRFIDDRVVYASNYRYKVRLVTELGMGPFSDPISACSGPAPEGYKRPVSTSTPGKRMRELRQRILEAAKAEAAAIAGELAAPEPTATPAPAEVRWEEGFFVASAVASTPSATFETTRAKAESEHTWAHLIRPENDTAVPRTDCSDEAARAGICDVTGPAASSTPRSAKAWFYKTLLSKVLGGMDLSASA